MAQKSGCTATGTTVLMARANPLSLMTATSQVGTRKPMMKPSVLNKPTTVRNATYSTPCA
jgi:hypothetical protein